MKGGINSSAFLIKKVMAKELTKDNFDEVVLRSEQPVLVDFWAQWCGPCKAIGPIIEELNNEFNGKVLVGKVDVDANQELAVKFGIMNIPTVLFFKNGQVEDKLKGVAPKREFVKKLESLLS
ncbi:thioredoxin [Prolixibacter sp. SD074]|jgi:thioredoxin 1|uniref:thioredoxin n=1 Tax=Prolixibacter sp. SD074 TaxID=2652391 RepID=UPI001281E59E|nr:thioredoxin [Prolixibacter sp. SD074]GET28794.1 thioredoxin [Prolixibacter sp. SD074]